MRTELETLIRGSEWFMRVLRCIRDERLPDAWVGAGALRDLVWGELYGPGFRPEDVHDVDVAFFDPRDLSRDHDDVATARLSARCAGVPWQARNQAAVHTWYASKFGGDPPAPLTRSPTRSAPGRRPRPPSSCGSGRATRSISAPRSASLT